MFYPATKCTHSVIRMAEGQRRKDWVGSEQLERKGGAALQLCRPEDENAKSDQHPENIRCCLLIMLQRRATSAQGSQDRIMRISTSEKVKTSMLLQKILKSRSMFAQIKSTAIFSERNFFWGDGGREANDYQAMT